MSGFITTSPTLSFNLDTVITFTTIKDESGNSNGKLASSNTEWRTYYQYDQGPLTISAKSGYWIHDVTFTYKEGADAILVNNKNDVTRVWNPDDTINILGTSRTWYTGHTKGTGGYLCFTKFKVVYYKLPTRIDMDASLTVEPNSVFKIGQILPYNAYQVWSTTDESKVSVDQNGVVTAKEEGSATIKVTFGDGTSKSCDVKVETSSDESVVEDFKEVVLGSASTTTVEGQLANWEFVTIRRNAADTLRNGQKGSRFNAVATAHYATKTALEGCIKRVSFYWNSASPFNENNHNFIVSAGNVKDTVIKLVVSESTKERIAKGDVIYTHDFNVKQNATLSITNNQTARYLLIGNIKVSPYLLYTTKSASVNCKTLESYNLKTGLIDNTNGTVTFKAEQASGWKGKIKDGILDLSDVSSTEDITVTASWEGVTTTMKLTVADAYAAVTGVTFNVPSPMDVTVGNQFQIIGTVAPNTANPKLTWSSSAEGVVEVDKNGIIKVKGEGQAIITATAVNGKSASCTINAAATTDKFFTESYSKLAATSGGYRTSVDTFTADNGIKWQFRHYKFEDASKIEGNPGVDMNCNSVNSYIAYYSDKDGCTGQEGGVKRISFNWKAVDPTKPVRFEIDDSNVSGSAQVMSLPANAVSGTQFYSYDLNDTGSATKNVALRIRNINSTSNSSIIVGPVTITPYLLYTNKDTAVYMKDSKTYTNPGLINNTTGTAPEYSISCGSDTAEIDADGKVTIKKSAIVTVKATWGNVSTSYRLTMHAKEAPVIVYADQHVDMNQAPFTPTPTSISEGVGTPSYSSSDTTVVKVDAESGELTIMGADSAKITVNYTEGTVCAAASVSYKVYVTDPMEEAIIEAFKDIQLTNVTTNEIEGDCANWNFKNIRRSWSADNPEILASGTHASRLHNIGAAPGVDESYIRSHEALEGGIKRVSFKWNKESPSTCTLRFTVTAGTKVDMITKELKAEKGRLAAKDVSYNHNFLVKQNAVLSIDNQDNYYPLIGDSIKITPYIYYTRRDTTVLAKDYVSATLTNDKFINNVGSEGSITYSIENAESMKAIAEILDETNGAVTIHGAGDVVVKATWSEGATTTYNLHILKEKPTVTMEGAAIDAFGTYTPAPVAKLNGVAIENPVFSYKSSNELVATVDNNGVVAVHSLGTTNIRAILAEGANYQSDSVEAVLKVNEPVGDSYWKETFDSVPDISDYITSTKTYYGNKAVYWWQMRSFQHNTSGNKDKVGSEQGVRIKFDSKNNNYIASNRVEEGGIQAVFFNWCLAGDGTATARFSRIAPKNDAKHSKNDTLNIVRENVSKGYDQVNSYVEVLNIDKNARFQVRIPSGDEAVVFGPITIKPYLLYTTKDTTINVLEYNGIKTFTNGKLINNTGVEPEGDGITYSIKSVTPAGAAEILEANKHNGQVTINGAGTAVVQAKWGDVTTTYTLRISGGDLELSFAQSHIDTTMNAEIVTNELSGMKAGAGALTYTSDNVRVAKVDKTTGVVSAMGPGDATITANVAAGTIYKADSAKFTIHVDEVTDPKEKKISESFPDYTGSPWLMSAIGAPDTIIGEQGLWKVSYARHNATKDKLTNERAVWLNTNGYVSTLWNIGGIKRVKFVYNKKKISNRFSVIAGDIKDTVYAETMGDEYTYCHNFFLKKDTTLKIHNICATDENLQEMLFGTIVITPYLYYTKKNDTIKAADYQEQYYSPKFLINNTNDNQHITYTSSNPTAAEVITGDQIDIHAAAAEPVIITAKWKTSDTDSIVTSFSLFIQDKDKRKAAFTLDSVSVERGDTAENTLNIIPVLGDTDPVVEYVSSDPKIAKIADDKKTVIALSPGTVSITAQIGETKKSLAGSASYVLTVTYTPEEGTYWKETFSKCTSEGGTGAGVKADVEGDDGLKNWQLIKFQRRNPDDKVGDEQGIQVRYSGEITSKNALEGGIKEVVFNWRPFNTAYAPHFYVQAGDSVDTISHAAVLDAAKVIPYAHEFKQKNNAILKIGNFAQETPEQQGFVEVGVIKVLPYLLYTRKDTMVYAKDLADKNFKFFNNKWYNNTNGEGKISYSIKAKDNAVTMEGDSVKILKEGTDTIQASWESVTTTYVIHTVLEDAKLAFAQDQVTVYLDKTNEYKAEISKDTDAEVNYEFIGEHGSATIDKEGNVHFTEADTLTIRASVEQKLPYKAGADTLTLIVSKALPELSFSPDVKEVTMNEVSFTHTATVTKGEGAPVYSSSDITVAKVNANTGKVTVVGAGNAVITATMVESEEWAEAKATYSLTVTDPMEDAVVENFNNETYKASENLQIRDGKLATWEYQYTRRATTDTLKNGTSATWMNYVTAAHLKTTEVLEGGIKRVSFLWNRASINNRIVEFVVAAGDAQQNKDTVSVSTTGSTALITPDWVYNHNFSVKQNTKLSISRTGAKSGQESYMVFGDIKITPYLLYTMKDTTIKVGESYKNTHLIDNRDDETAITYSIIAGNEKGVASIDGEGNVSATRACELTIQAKWKTSEKDSVTTTYNLSIVPDKTTITLVRDNGTEEVDVIDNSYRTVMPQFTLPTRTGYRFNAYWTAAKGKGIRFTVTTDKGVTAWVKDRWINPDSLVDGNRKWIYEGTTYTLYAEWRPERKIALDNQGATTPGTDTVVTAYCPNNNLLRLTQSITKPAKANSTFMGYYTEENGAGSMLIDANGAFVASVENYTDSSKWFIKDADITLYAYWVLNKMTLKESEDNSANIAMCAGHTVDVELVRSLNPSMLNTFCLPFDVNEDMMIDIFGENYQLITFKSAVLNAKKDSIDLRFKTATSIQAGVPYLIQPSKEVKNPTFEQVTVVNTTGKPAGTGSITMYGVINPTHVSAGNTILLMANNQFTWTNEEDESEKMKGMRAYFEVDEEAKAALRRYSPRLCVDQADTPTELMQNAQCTMQSVRKMIIDNQLVIIREGKMFNAQGALVK